MRIAALALAAVLVFVVVLGAVATAVLGAGTSSTTSAGPSRAAAADVPPDMLALYARAAAYANTALRCPALDWALLAAIGKIETDHGRSRLPGVTSGENNAGAGGPMQIIGPTWHAIVSRHLIPPGGAAPPSRYNPHDAIHAAAVYLCDNGAGTGDLRAAVFAYNHADSYVDMVLDQATRYRPTPPDTWAPDTWAPEHATLPDPTGTGGHLTPRMHTLYQALTAAGATTGGATCWDPHPHNPASDHPRGKACDIFFNPHDPADVTRGWRTAQWLTTVHAAYGIRYLIWQGRIWTAQSPIWNTYQSGIYGCPDPANLTGCHYNHIHVSVE